MIGIGNLVVCFRKDITLFFSFKKLLSVYRPFSYRRTAVGVESCMPLGPHPTRRPTFHARSVYHIDT